MAQLTIYVPDDIAKRLKREARQAKKSLSAYLTDLATRGQRVREWPAGFFELQGSLHGELEIPEDPPPEEPDVP